jgi:hypothetical protein
MSEENMLVEEVVEEEEAKTAQDRNNPLLYADHVLAACPWLFS